MKESFRFERLEEDQNVVNEAQTAIRRVAARLRISEDRATNLLVFFRWYVFLVSRLFLLTLFLLLIMNSDCVFRDENRLDSEFLLLSDYFVSNPQFNPPSMVCFFYFYLVF